MTRAAAIWEQPWGLICHISILTPLPLLLILLSILFLLMSPCGLFFFFSWLLFILDFFQLSFLCVFPLLHYLSTAFAAFRLLEDLIKSAIPLKNQVSVWSWLFGSGSIPNLIIYGQDVALHGNKHKNLLEERCRYASSEHILLKALIVSECFIIFSLPI